MKKLFTTVLALALCASMALMTACGGSYFDGNYSETTKEELTTFSEEVNAANDGKIDIFSGVKIEMEIDVPSKDGSQKISLASFIGKDPDNAEAYVMQCKLKTEATDESADIEVNYKSGVAYVKMVSGDETTKIKSEVDVEDVIDEYMSEYASMISMYNLDYVIKYIVEEEGVKFYIDKKDDSTKVKVAVDMTQTYGEGTEHETTNESKGEIVLVYDADKNLKGLKFELQNKFTSSEGTQNMSNKIIVEPWSGNVSVPSDADSYEAA